MALPIAFPSETPRLRLPVLYPGQAQKEFTINEALARMDAVLHPAIEGEITEAPPAPTAGECWLVADAATGIFADHVASLAYFDGRQWSFMAPVTGMAVYDKSAAVLRRYADNWSQPVYLQPPVSGATVDAEARAVIVALLQALEGLSVLKRG